VGATERLTIDLPVELYPVLERLAREQARAPQGQASWIVREALQRSLRAGRRRPADDFRDEVLKIPTAAGARDA
jgi:hypothetical protein